MRSYAILGTGAIGGLYGAKLHAAGFPVHFLCYRDYEVVKTQGLRVDSIWGNLHLTDLHVYADPQKMPTVDVVIVALKTTQNHLLAQLIPPLLSENSLVLVLQNGLGIEDEIADWVDERVLGGLCFTCSNKRAPGYVHHLDFGKITLGEYRIDQQPSGITPKLEAIAADFSQAGIPIEVLPDLLLARWKKLVWNIPFNGLSVVLNATTDILATHPETRALALALMREVQTGAAACDRQISDEFLAEMLEATVQMKPYLTSMKLDFEAGRSLEVEAIFGNPLRTAQKLGVHLPQITVLYHQLRFLDQQNRLNSPQ